MTYDFDNSLIQIIDKTQSTPVGITEGGLIDGDLKPFYARLTQKVGDGLVPSAVLSLYIQLDGKFTRTVPILIDKDAPDKYLIQIKMEQVGKTSELQRYRLSTPTFTDDPDLGEIMQIPLESIAYNALVENKSALNDELVNPKQRAINILGANNGQGGSQNVILAFDDSDIDIPDNDALQFDYKPTSPKPIGELLNDVIDRIEQAGPLGGVFKNFFYHTFASSIFTNVINIFFEEFGKNDSGVVIDPDNDQEASPNDKALFTSNKKRKKIVLVKFGNRSGSLPMEHVRFASLFEHAKIRKEWIFNKPYLKGDVVKFTFTGTVPNVIRFFTASNDVTSISNPNIDNFNWFEDFTIIPHWSVDALYTVPEVISINQGGTTIKFFVTNDIVNPGEGSPALNSKWTEIMTSRPSSTYEPFVTYTPFTNDLQNAKRNLAAVDSPPAGYVGYAIDWNYEVILNDIPDYTNRFKIITGKSIRRIENTPPINLDRELYDGFRVLVGTAPTGEFAGHSNQIAEFVRDLFQGISPHWEFSDDPINNDTINLNHDTGEMLAFQGGNWVVVWDITKNDLPSSAHLVKDIRLVKGSSGIPGQALEQRFDWNRGALGGNGNDNNKTSRGAWYHDMYPKPISDSASTNLGGTYGGNGDTFPNNPRINHINLNQNRKGLIGYNRGLDSEDMGRITEHGLKIRLGLWNSSDETTKALGYANIPMIYWRKDFNSRFFFKEFSILENNEFYTVEIKLPPFGTTNIFFSRINELVKLLGYTLPFDFFIKEKEFSGVKYEFRKNDSWGVFMKGAYNNQGLFKGYSEQSLDNWYEMASQIIPQIQSWIANPSIPNIFNTEQLAIDHTLLAIDEEYYIKEGYAISPQISVDDPRTEIIQMQQETDYLTARANADSRIIKNDFYPNERHVSCGGNIDIKYGQEITETGSRIPDGSLSSVVSYTEQIFDNKGFNNRLFLIRKFVIT